MSTFLLLSAFAAQTAAPPPPSPTPPAAAAAAAEPDRGVSTYVDLEAGVGYSTNPQFRFGGDTGAGFGRIAITAVHSRFSERSSTLFSAFAQNSFYTNNVGSQQSIELSASHSARVSEQLRLFGDASVGYDKGGQLDTSFGPSFSVLLPTGGAPIILPPGSDFLSVTGKTFRISGHLGAQYALNAREFLTASAGVEHVTFDRGAVDTRYTRIPVSLGYDRQISTRTTIGARISAQTTDYNGPANFRSITPELTLQTALSETVTLSGGVGVSFARSDDGINTRHSTGLSANASVCSRGERSQFCGRASVDQQAATVAGPARTVSVGLDYSRQLDADQTIRFSANASRYSSPVFVVSGPSFSRSTYVRGAADYSRRLNDRLFGGVNVSVRKISQTGPDPKADLSGSLFVRYRLGDAR